MQILQWIKGGVLGLVLVLNLVIMAGVFCVAWLVSKLMPAAFSARLCESIYQGWLAINDRVLKTFLPTRWDFSGVDQFSPDQFYLLICNHQAWADILILHLAFRGRASHLKFFMKRALLWQLPVASWVCAAMGYPFVHRHTPAQIKRKPALMGQDLRTVQKACQRLRSSPSTLVNFLEGTRFTPEKAKKSNTPYQHLLRAQGSGVSAVINALGDSLSGIIDVTIAFPPKASMWGLLCGQVGWVKLHARKIDLDVDWQLGDLDERAYRRKISANIQQVWAEKDQRLQAWQEEK